MDAEPVVAATLLDPSVALALEVAQREAARRGHRQVGVEHMLLALLADPQLAHCVDRAGAKLEAARGHLEAALEERGPFRVESGDAGLGYRLARVLDLSQASAIPDDPLSLLSALVAESGAAVALAAEADLTPALWASSTLERAPAEAAPGSPYRSAHKTLGWTVSLRASEPLPAERLMAILAGTGLDDFGVARAMVVAATGRARPVGLFTEHDARSWVQVIEERAAAAGLSLTAEVMRCSPPAALLALRAKNLRWRWRVRGLWIAAAACLLGALIWAGLQWRELDRAPLSIEAARLAAPGERVRIKGRAEPAAPRYLLSEGVLFTADPRNPREVFSVFDDSLYRTRDVRVTFRAIPQLRSRSRPSDTSPPLGKLAAPCRAGSSSLATTAAAMSCSWAPLRRGPRPSKRACGTSTRSACPPRRSARCTGRTAARRRSTTCWMWSRCRPEMRRSWSPFATAPT
ncbi:MAG: hypothetical protein IPM79_32645 [Polyangiaceae bacterium]|nr:hypothetical protein [Polyangiaceae bacterium]